MGFTSTCFLPLDFQGKNFLFSPLLTRDVSLFSVRRLGTERDRERADFDRCDEGRETFLSTEQKALAMAVSENFTGSRDDERRAAMST